MATKTRPAEPTVETTTRRPPEPSTEELALAQGNLAQHATSTDLLGAPTLEPPDTAAGAAAGAVAAGWLTNKHVLMLWQTAGARDHWMYLDGGTGWRIGCQANDGAARGIALLAAGARTGGRIVNVYEGTSGAVDGIYLW